MLRLSDPDPVERVEEAAQAKAEATHRRIASQEAMAVRHHVLVVNHIAHDIGVAYALTRKKGQ
jgi:hypothetical protein